MHIKGTIARLGVVAVLLAVITLLFRRWVPVNPTTVALTFLVLVLLTSAYWGFRVALIAAIVTTTLFNFFFLPPVGTFNISDPQNWIALFAFLITAIVASNLAERARREAEAAQQRREEVERLYALSQQLLTSDDPAQLFNSLPAHIAQTFGAEGAALVVGGRDTIYRSRPDVKVDRNLLHATNLRGEISECGGISYVPLRIGVKPAGALAIVGPRLSLETLEAMGSLVGIAAERARAIDELARSKAAQENEKLRSALLDSVTHEFRTPLTSIKASVTGLLEENMLDATQRKELLSVIDEETDRLNRLIGEAAEMAQLDAHMFRLQKAPHNLRDVATAAIGRVGNALESHLAEIDIPADIPKVSFDFDKICEVVAHLLDNAAKYSPKGSPVRISAENKETEVVLSVSDHGSGIDPLEQSLIFEKFYRGREQRPMAQGTGMGLAISKVIVEAHGGSLSLVSQVGSGSVFSIHLPVPSRPLQ